MPKKKFVFGATGFNVVTLLKYALALYYAK
jgi:hypothetical protein